MRLLWLVGSLALALLIAVLTLQVPAPFSLEDVMKAKADDPSALHVVLFQEVEGYNLLLSRVRASCARRSAYGAAAAAPPPRQHSTRPTEDRKGGVDVRNR